MKCPQCGAWNQASLPRCFRCGHALSAADAVRPDWRNDFAGENGREKIVYDVDDTGNNKKSDDEGDRLAEEMQNLRERKLRGQEEQRRLRGIETQPYSAKMAGRIQQSTTRRRYVVDNMDDLRQPTRRQRRSSFAEHQPQQEPAQHIDYDDYHTGNTSSYTPLDHEGKPIRSLYSDDEPVRAFQHRQFRPLRFIRLTLIFVLVIGVTLGGLYYFRLPPFSSAETEPLQNRVQISTSIYDDLPAHIIRIPAEDGSEIYIKELHTTGIAIAGYATFEVPDYKWYADLPDIEDEVYTVTMTPYLKTASGQQKLMDVLHFDIDIPLSPITLVSPDVLYVEVNSRPKYQIQFKVERGSTVTINGENYSDLVSSQDGLLSYNATVQAIGENNIVIECSTKYYRKNTMTMVLYREPQDILLELDDSISERWSGDTNTMEVTGTTLNKATIRVLSEHTDLDTSRILSTGTFSFKAVFNRIGTNTITIEASYPGKKTTIVNFDVYHVPSARNYTPKAWPMDAYNYTQYLDTLATRSRNTTIYVCKGTIVQILSDSPQRALMETGSETTSRQVLLDNLSNDTWEVGDTLRVYGDAYGAYDGKPWLVGRYTYPYKP